MSGNHWFTSIPHQSVECIENALKSDQSLTTLIGWKRQTLLHKAILTCRLEVVNLFLKYGSDPNSCDDDGRTPVHFACSKGRLDVLVALIQFCADITLVDNFGQGCIHHAASAGSVLILHYLHVVHNQTLNIVDKNLITPVHIVCNTEQLNALRYFLRQGRCRINAIDVWGNSVLHLAASNGSESMCWEIVSSSSDGAKLLTVKDKYGRTPCDVIKDSKRIRQKELLKWLRKWELYHLETDKAVPSPNLLWLANGILAPAWFILTMFICKLLPFLANGIVATPSFLILAPVLLRKTHRIHHPSRLPEPAFAGLFISGFISSVLCYIYNISAYYYSNIVINLLSMLAICGSSYFMLRILNANPGVVARAEQVKQSHKFAISDLKMWHFPFQLQFDAFKWLFSTRSVTKLPIPDHSVADVGLGFSPASSFCECCEIVQPDKVRHCKLCDSCCWKMDHHCLFVQKCVAGLNQRAFVLMLIFVLFGNIMFLVAVYTYWTSTFDAISLALLHSWNHDFWTLTMVIGNSLCMLWTGNMLIYQLDVISHKTSTISRLKDTLKPKVSITVKERVKNILYFMKTGTRGVRNHDAAII